ncbi:MAG: hypothetical protein FJX75_11215 [Armatimonadetes bacterium]|nr:hypothetical protein [Armatimonadota bacterium]
MQATPDAGAAAAAGFGVIILLVWLLIFAAIVAGLVFWVIALVDAARREFPGQNDKLMWVLIVVLAGIPGALVYWFAGRPRGTLPGAPAQIA